MHACSGSLRLVGTEDDGQRLERALSGIDGVTAASVSLPAQVARVELHRSVVTPDAITRRLADAGVSLLPAAPPVVPATAAGVEARPSWYARNHELAWSLTAGVLLAAAWPLERRMGLGPVVRGIYLVSYFLARDNVGHFVKDLRGGHLNFDIDLLMVVAKAPTQQAPTQRVTDRFERIFVPIELVADALLVVVPPLLGSTTAARPGEATRGLTEALEGPHPGVRGAAAGSLAKITSTPPRRRPGSAVTNGIAPSAWPRAVIGAMT